MTIQKGYAVIKSTVLLDKQISLIAKGIFAYLSSLPEGSCVTDHDVYKWGADSDIDIKDAIHELLVHGYIIESNEVGE